MDNDKPDVPREVYSAFASETVRHETPVEATLAVMREVAYCKKISSQGLPYTYASEEELLNVLRPALIRNGITMQPVAVEQIHTGEFTSKTTKALQLQIRLKVTYRLCYALKGGKTATETVEVVGEGMDVQDKGTGKAMTAALKYALRQSFLIATGDDPDKFASQPVVAFEKESDQALRETYLKFLGAVETAETQTKLDKFQKLYLHERPFTDGQREALEQAHAKRAAALRSATPTNK